MGGDVSTRWKGHEPRATTEASWLLDIKKLKRPVSRLPEVSSGSCRALKISTGTFKEINYDDPTGGADRGPLVTLAYSPARYSSEVDPLATLSDPLARVVSLPVELNCTELHNGGRVWWFSCPLTLEEGGVCGRRARKLWLPQGHMYLGCAKCHDLTHESSLRCHPPSTRWPS